MNSSATWTCYKKHLTMKKNQNWCLFLWTNSNAFNQVYDVSSIARCKFPSPSLRIAKRSTLPIMHNASVAWTDSILPFVNVQEISSPSKSQHKSCVKGWSRNSCWIYILWQWESYLMGKKNIRWCRWRYEGKSFKMFKIKSFWKR